MAEKWKRREFDESKPVSLQTPIDPQKIGFTEHGIPANQFCKDRRGDLISYVAGGEVGLAQPIALKVRAEDFTPEV
jgi:hypothetical protein